MTITRQNENLGRVAERASEQLSNSTFCATFFKFRPTFFHFVWLKSGIAQSRLKGLLNWI